MNQSSTWQARRRGAGYGLSFVVLFLTYHRLLQVRFAEFLQERELVSSEGQFFKVFRWYGAAGHDWQVWARLDQTRRDGYLAGWFSTPLNDRSYTSKFGIGDWIITSLVAEIGPQTTALRAMYTLLALATAFTIVAGVRFVSRHFGVGAAVAWCAGLLLPWSLQMWSSVWWNFPIRMMPILVVPYLLRHRRPSKGKRIFALSCIFCLVLLAEYILFSLTFFGCVGIALVSSCLRGNEWGTTKQNLLDVLISSVISVVAAVSFHLLQLRALSGSWRQGIAEFRYNATKRLVETDSGDIYETGTENLVESLDFGVREAIARIVETPLFGLTGVPGLRWLTVGVLLATNFALMLLAWLGWRKRESSQTRVAAEAWFVTAIGGWLSWAVLVPSWFTHLEFARGVAFFASVPASLGLLVVQVADFSWVRRHHVEVPSIFARTAAFLLVSVVLGVAVVRLSVIHVL